MGRVALSHSPTAEFGQERPYSDSESESPTDSRNSRQADRGSRANLRAVGRREQRRVRLGGRATTGSSPSGEASCSPVVTIPIVTIKALSARSRQKFPMKFFSEYLMVDPTDSEYFLPLIQYRAEQGPPRKAIFLKFDDMLVVLHTVASHRKSCCFHKPLHRRNRT